MTTTPTFTPTTANSHSPHSAMMRPVTSAYRIKGEAARAAAADAGTRTRVRVGTGRPAGTNPRLDVQAARDMMRNLGAGRPHPARMRDYLLGGARNFGLDRAAAQQLVPVFPDTEKDVWATRAFAHRAVAELRSRGVTQLLDLGCGLPTADDAHEFASSLNADCRIAYVDADPIVAECLRQVTRGVPHAHLIETDLRRVDDVLAQAGEVLDLSEPIGLIATGVLEYLPDREDPAAILATYRAGLAAGSLLVLAHATPAALSFAQARAICGLYESFGMPLALRDSAEVSRLLEGWTLMSADDERSGECLVPVSGWRPDPLHNGPTTSTIYGGVASLEAGRGCATRMTTAQVARRNLNTTDAAGELCQAAVASTAELITPGGTHDE